MCPALLVVDDDAEFAATIARFLSKEGYSVDVAHSGEEAIGRAAHDPPDYILLDLFLPGINGLETLARLKELGLEASVLVMTAHGSVDAAVEAMRLGATDFLAKPIDLEALCLKLEQARRLVGMQSDLDYLLHRERKSAACGDMVGSSPAMSAVYDKIREVAKTDNTTVLVTGESGTGKELVARAVHQLSARSHRPLMQIDCTSIPLNLLESELFGHERGAFTGADKQKKGLLELADGGSLLLDEIGDMPLELQSKLLRVLQQREFRRVGGTRDLHFDVRVIAATNQDLGAMADTGRFRRDLLYRLKVFQVELPPLRERGRDVVELAQMWLNEYARAFRKSVQGFSPQAEQALLAYRFPGNVRELRNIVEQAVILTKDEWVGPEFLPGGALLSSTATVATSPSPVPVAEATVPAPTPQSPATGLDLDALGDEPLVKAERALIEQALTRCGGNKKRAALRLGISRFALQRRIEKLGIDLGSSLLKKRD